MVVQSRWLFLAFAVSVLGVCGCTPSIGDACNLSTDCSVRGDRVCDSSQPLGYCTIRNCGGNSCPENAACVLFNAAPAGCPYDDRAPGRTARSFCMVSCQADKNCREGYICADPKGDPWRALILDDAQDKRVCIPSSKQTSVSPTSSTPPVCSATGPVVPTLDASPPWTPIDGGAAADASVGSDAGADAGAEAGSADAG